MTTATIRTDIADWVLAMPVAVALGFRYVYLHDGTCAEVMPSARCVDRRHQVPPRAHTSQGLLRRQSGALRPKRGSSGGGRA